MVLLSVEVDWCASTLRPYGPDTSVAGPTGTVSAVSEDPARPTPAASPDVGADDGGAAIGGVAVSSAEATLSVAHGRARRVPPTGAVVAVGVLIGIAVVAAGLVWWAGRDDDRTITGTEAADAFVEAYTRTVDATVLIEGEQTRTLADGRTLGSAYLVVQRPPDRLQRSLGSTAGVVNGRTVNCGTPVGGRYTCGAAGVAEPPEVRRATVLGALETYVRGDDPVYSVTSDEKGCFELVRRRTELDATFGQGANLCFDARTGGIRRLEVRREGGATDVMRATRLTGDVSNADFDLGADETYDPQVPDGDGPPSSTP